MTPAGRNDAHGYAPVAAPIYGDDGENPLAESFVGVSSIADIVSPEPAHTYLEVIAPATLPEVSFRVGGGGGGRGELTNTDICGGMEQLVASRYFFTG